MKRKFTAKRLLNQNEKKYCLITAGFTLIELLVVIAIIALLMAILPALSRAKEHQTGTLPEQPQTTNYCMDNVYRRK